MHFEESMIPREVWDFVKKHTSSMITAGILAMVIWNFLKKNKKEESYSERLDKLLEKHYKVTFIDKDNKIDSKEVEANSKTDAVHKVIDKEKGRQLKKVTG